MAEPKINKRVPYYKKPEELTVDQWQSELRKQFALEQKLRVTNLGTHPVYSDFKVFNPESEKTYKVSIRDNINSYNYCSCPDFKINTLGTCKHIEFVLFRLLKYKKYQKYFGSEQQHDYSSLSILYGHERMIRLKKAESGIPFENEKAYFDKQGYLLPGMISNLDCFIKDTIKTDPKFRVYPDVFQFIQQHKKSEERNEKLKEIFPEGPNSKIFNNLINTNLYPYQKEGVIDIIKKGRILLADDMGLGKTIQAIAAVKVFADFFSVNKVLIICPTSLKYQWQKEIEKFASRDACVVEGLIHKRKELYAQKDLYKIVSYGAARNDIKHINDWGADLVIIDEAQRIKNWKTQTAQSVKKIVSDFVIVITGTPLENRIDELHSIVEYIDRYKLGPLFRFLDNHQVLDDHGKLIGYENLRTINRTLNDILLRRTKEEISDQLPGRMDKNFFVEMTKEQMSDHNDYYDVVSRLVNKWIRTGFLNEEERQNLLTCLNCMRMVSDTTYILNQKTNHGNKIGEIKELVKEIIENPGNKVVIFSQWKRMFELLIRELDKMDVSYVYLNGDVPAAQRNVIIERFQSDPELKIFLSTDAGGVGVNLQSANILINIDLPWNPAVLEQRIGRIHRIGQTKHINVFNFIAAGSIEHRILHLLDYKKSVFAGVIEEEGEDQVMLDGFLASVKAMTDVNFELSGYKAGTQFFTRDEDNLAAEANARYLQGEGNEEETKQQISHEQGMNSNNRNNSDANRKPSVLRSFGKKIKRFLQRVFRF
ncbi:MAG: DEAD/DEAH box helicase [Bacteroidales bacterium]|nr:DEAD/DEAH box helicase [Bacteroidales bacterium]